MNVSNGQLQVGVRLFLIESGKCRRQSLSDAAIGWRAPSEATPDAISTSRLVVDARGEDVVVGNAFRMADVVARRVGVVGGGGVLILGINPDGDVGVFEGSPTGFVPLESITFPKDGGP